MQTFMLSSKNAQFLGYVDLRTPTILSSEIKCPKSGIFTNNYWWSESGRVISQVSIAVFFGRCKKKSCKDGSVPLDKIGPYAYGFYEV